MEDGIFQGLWVGTNQWERSKDLTVNANRVTSYSRQVMGKYTVGQGCSGVVTASVSLGAAMLGRMIRDPARAQEMEDR